MLMKKIASAKRVNKRIRSLRFVQDAKQQRMMNIYSSIVAFQELCGLPLP
jgi:hypothetical protein